MALPASCLLAYGLPDSRPVSGVVVLLVVSVVVLVVVVAAVV